MTCNRRLESCLEAFQCLCAASSKFPTAARGELRGAPATLAMLARALTLVVVPLLSIAGLEVWNMTVHLRYKSAPASGTQTMRAVRYSRHGGRDVLHVVEDAARPLVPALPGMLVVKVAGAALNPVGKFEFALKQLPSTHCDTRFRPRCRRPFLGDLLTKQNGPAGGYVLDSSSVRSHSPIS